MFFQFFINLKFKLSYSFSTFVWRCFNHLKIKLLGFISDSTNDFFKPLIQFIDCYFTLRLFHRQLFHFIFMISFHLHELCFKLMLCLFILFSLLFFCLFQLLNLILQLINEFCLIHDSYFQAFLFFHKGDRFWKMSLF